MDNVKEKFTGVFDYILTEETDYKTRYIPLAPNWNWNMKDHVDRSFQLVNTQYTKGDNDFSRPNNNIILPIRAVNVRSEGFDVKDIQIYVNDSDNYHKSLLARKKHNKWAKKYSIDTAIDESVESYFDYGLVLAKNVNEERPEIVPLQTIAFVDQTDVLAGPICLKHQYSVSQLLDMKGKWYEREIDIAINNSKFSRIDANGQEVKTPGKYIEIYELHGTFPESWLGKEKLGDGWEDEGKYTPQIHIVTYYKDLEDGLDKGLCLFKGKEPKPIFKALKRDGVFGRACGRGGIEELFHAQIWTNNSLIHLQQMVEATSKVILKGSKKVAKHNNLKNMKHGQIVEVDENEKFEQMMLQPINKPAFDALINKWEQVGRTIGSASDPSLGLNPVSGTPLGTTEIVTQQGIGIHEYRQGQLAQFWGEIYRDWVLQYLADDLNKGDKWVDELTLEELQEVAEKVSTSTSNKRIKEMVTGGKIVSPQEQELMRTLIKDDFVKGGRKRFFEIMKKEFADLPLDVEFSIASKQENLFETVSKLNAVFRAVFSPAGVQALRAEPAVGELLNQILEKSGFSPLSFAGLTKAQEGGGAPQEAVPSPIQQPDLVTQ